MSNTSRSTLTCSWIGRWRAICSLRLALFRVRRRALQRALFIIGQDTMVGGVAGGKRILRTQHHLATEGDRGLDSFDSDGECSEAELLQIKGGI